MKRAGTGNVFVCFFLLGLINSLCIKSFYEPVLAKIKTKSHPKIIKLFCYQNVLLVCVNKINDFILVKQ